MQNIFIELLPPWVETGLQPAFYDKESGTVLQQVSRMYAKINQLIGSVNNQNTTIADYIQKFIDLKDYVDTYFNNLDIQAEVNNKLDQMASSGQLANIIAQYLQAQAVFGFDTIAEMSASENLANGAICKVLGKTNYQTGDGAFYKIRNITSDDVIDGVNKVKITHDNTLIAELITDYYINELNTKVEQNSEAITKLETKTETDLHKLTLQPKGYYSDNTDNGLYQGCAIINDILYVYRTNKSLYQFSLLTNKFIGIIKNIEFGHGNSMTSIGNRIFCGGGAGQDNNIYFYDIDTGNSGTLSGLTTIVSAGGISGLSKLDNKNLIVTMASTYGANNFDLTAYIYNIENNTYTELETINTKGISCGGATSQGMEYYDGKIYQVYSGSNAVYVGSIDTTANTLTWEKVLTLEDFDTNGIPASEIEDLAIYENGGQGTMVLTSNDYSSGNALSYRLINPIYNIASRGIISPSTRNQNNAGIDGYINNSSEYMYEDGSENYPFKDIRRAVYAQNYCKDNKFAYMVINGGDNYYWHEIKNFDRVALSASAPVTIYGVADEVSLLNCEHIWVDGSANNKYITFSSVVRGGFTVRNGGQAFIRGVKFIGDATTVVSALNGSNVQLINCSLQDNKKIASTVGATLLISGVDSVTSGKFTTNASSGGVMIINQPNTGTNETTGSGITIKAGVK